MPSIMTLEGPRLGQPAPSKIRSLASVVQASMMSPAQMALWAIGGAALIGVAWLFVRKPGRSLRGPSMLKIIASEARTPEEFARRAEAWNAAEREPLSVAALAKAYKKAKPSTVARLIREAHETRVEGRERLWSRMSRGLRGDPPKLRVGQHLDYIGQTFRITSITRGKNPVVYIARPSKDSFGREHMIDARSFPLREFDRQHLKPLDGLRGLDGYRVYYVLNVGGKVVRAPDDHEFEMKATAINRLKQYKRRGMTAWVEDANGFVPVPGAMRPNNLSKR